MNNNLKILEVDQYATIDEIKHQYRRLAKLYHPDYYKGGSEKFREIQNAYEILLKIHKPLKKSVDTTGYEKFYRVLDGEPEFKIILPIENILDRGIILYCMYNLTEIKITFEKGEKFPKTIITTNTTPNIKLNIVPENNPT